MRVLTVVGARPQFVKAAPVCRALAGRGIHEVLVHTGQHYDAGLSEVFFEQLELPRPDYHLGVGSGSHGVQTARMLEALEGVIVRERPEWVLVYGDTNSTLAGALAAAKLGVAAAHVEAGLRSFNRAMPEEINRVVADHLSELLFCPTEAAVANLAAEGIREGVHRVGDVMYDSVLHNLRLAERAEDPLAELGISPRCYYLATVHRAGNTDVAERLTTLVDLLSGLEVPVVLPLHPRTAKALEEHGIEAGRGSLRPVEPVPYLQMLVLERAARAILTDSGGVQKEAYFFKVPCVTLRPETEWVETVEAGWNAVVDADRERFGSAVAAVRRWDGAGPPFAPSGPRAPAEELYGDGHAAEAIAGLLAQRGGGEG